MIDISELEGFARKCEAMQADLKPYAGKTLEEIGEDFLDIVQRQIQESHNIDKGTLLKSFTKGGAGNIFQLDMGALTLTIGTDVYYAHWVNKGHPQKRGRFIPGIWEGPHFRYIPGATTGMVLKASAVKGSHFFDGSVEKLEEIFPKKAKSAFEQFFNRYFS